jgi:hypothetical protein
VGAGVTAPSVATYTWLLGALDPVLIAVAVILGWKADQLGKVFIAAIAAFGISVLAAWLITLTGLPWVAPVSRDVPTLYPVRAVAALIWATAAFGARKLSGR